MVHQHFVSMFPRIAYAGSFAIENGNGVDGIGVLMVENKDVVIATTGGDVKTTGLIRVGFQQSVIGQEHDSKLMGTRRKRRSKIIVDRVGGDVGE